MQRPDLVTKQMRRSRRSRKQAQAREARYLAQELWNRLSEAASAQEFAASWLDLQCKMIARTVQGVVVMGPPGKGPFVPVAHWPQGIADTSELATVAELAMEERRGVVRGFKGRRFEDGDATWSGARPSPPGISWWRYWSSRPFASSTIDSAPRPPPLSPSSPPVSPATG
jgi:hypothetical protein